jgi:hypothetical protein
MPEGPKVPNWWQTLPGLVTAAAALITAVAGAIVGLYQTGIIKRGVSQPQEIHNTLPITTSHRGKLRDEPAPENPNSCAHRESVLGNTDLLDDASHSYQPLEYDARQLRDKIQSFEAAPVLPGASADFALVFSVPRGTRPESLLFTLKHYDNLSGGTDVRILLKK